MNPRGIKNNYRKERPRET